MTKHMLDIKPLKRFALENLPPNSALRAILISEPDFVSVEEFLMKLGIWLKLVRFDDEAGQK
jgi:hypothetical protein